MSSKPTSGWLHQNPEGLEPSQSPQEHLCTGPRAQEMHVQSARVGALLQIRVKKYFPAKVEYANANANALRQPTGASTKAETRGA